MAYGRLRDLWAPLLMFLLSAFAALLGLAHIVSSPQIRCVCVAGQRWIQFSVKQAMYKNEQKCSQACCFCLLAIAGLENVSKESCSMPTVNMYRAFRFHGERRAPYAAAHDRARAACVLNWWVSAGASAAVCQVL